MATLKITSPGTVVWSKYVVPIWEEIDLSEHEQGDHFTMAEHNLDNVIVQYTHLLEPNTKFEPHKYQVTLGPLSDEHVKELTDQGLAHRISYGKDYSPHINMGSKVINPKTGSLNPVPEYVGPDLRDYRSPIGPGSVINVEYFTYMSSYGNTECTLLGVQVVNATEPAGGSTRQGFKEIA